jgi:iron(III) transport system substrate-binding protein
MKRHQRAARLLAVAPLLIISAAFSACGGGSSQSITVYSGQHEQTTNSLVQHFEQATGIHVDVRYNDEDALADQIVTEGSGSPADVIYTENSPALEFLDHQGDLAPVDASTLARTPGRFNATDGEWVGVSARVSVMIYDPALISSHQLPKTALALGNPLFRGKFAIAPGETDFQPIVTSMVRRYGTTRTLAWLDAVKANTSGHQYPDNETIADEVNRGSVAFGIVNQYYYYRMRAEIGSGSTHSAIAFFEPRDPGYVVDVSGAAVLKSSHDQVAAQKFVAFLVSREGQETIVHSISFEYPIVPGIADSPEETPFNQLRPNPISLSQLGTGSAAVALLQRAGLI